MVSSLDDDEHWFTESQIAGPRGLNSAELAPVNQSESDSSDFEDILAESFAQAVLGSDPSHRHFMDPTLSPYGGI